MTAATKRLVLWSTIGVVVLIGFMLAFAPERVTVDVVEPMMGDWEIRQKSQDFVKKDALTAVFSLAVPAGGEKVLTYRVQVRF